MIIFDLDCLADDSHRRHFIEKPWDYCNTCYELIMAYSIKKIINDESIQCHCGRFPLEWEENIHAYYEACNKDIPVEPIVTIWNNYEEQIAIQHADLQIWSGRCESLRSKKLHWLSENLFIHSMEWMDENLKMRPIGLDCSQESLFEHWLIEENCKKHPPMKEGDVIRSGDIKEQIEFVFSSDKPTIEMFRRRGIFVFDCNQER